MDPRVKAIADGALRKLSGGQASGPGSGTGLPAELRITHLSLAQLSRLSFLQAGDPMVDEVLAMLKAGRPVYLDRETVERELELDRYPPRVAEQFNKWFSRISGYGVALVGGTPSSPAPAPTPQAIRPALPAAPPAKPAARAVTLAAPDRQILSEILGEAIPEEHPCWIEPGKVCCGSGRCKTLGF